MPTAVQTAGTAPIRRGRTDGVLCMLNLHNEQNTGRYINAGFSGMFKIFSSLPYTPLQLSDFQIKQPDRIIM